MAAVQTVPVDQMRMTGAAPGGGALPPGALFDLPGVTTWFDQKENNDAMVTTLAQATATTAIFAAPFKQSDVVFGWEMGVTVSQVVGTANCTLSPYYPYNYIGAMSLTIQNQFNTLQYVSGYDAFLFQVIRPYRWESWVANVADQGPTGFQTNAYGAGVWQGTATNYTGNTGTQSIVFWVDLLPGVFFDLYYDLGPDGRLYSNAPQGIRTFVTPLAMAGSNRIVTPNVTYNPGISSTGDNGPLKTGASSTFSGTATLNWRRRGMYQPAGAADAPLFWNWQYVRLTRRVSLSGVSTIQVPLEPGLQILMFYIRMFDPTLNSGYGGVVPIANVSEVDVQIGSGLYRYQDTPADAQRRFFRQHGILLPEGVLCWDTALTVDARLTNARAINTYTTSSCILTITFTGAQSASAYLVVGTEGLRYVAFQ